MDRTDDEIFNKAFRTQQKLTARGLRTPRLGNALKTTTNTATEAGRDESASLSREQQIVSPALASTPKIPPQLEIAHTTRLETQKPSKNNKKGATANRYGQFWTRSVEFGSTVWSDICKVVMVTWTLVRGPSRLIAAILFALWPPLRILLIFTVVITVVVTALLATVEFIWQASHLATALSFVLTLGSTFNTVVLPRMTNLFHTGSLASNSAPMTTTASLVAAPSFTPTQATIFTPKGLAREFRDLENCVAYLSKIPVGEGQPAEVQKSVSIVWDVLLEGRAKDFINGSRNEKSLLTGSIAWNRLWDAIDPDFDFIKGQNALLEAVETEQHDTESAQAERMLKDMRQRPAEEEVGGTSGVRGRILALFGADGAEEARKLLVHARLNDFSKMVERARKSRQSMYDAVRTMPDTSMKGVKEHICEMKTYFLQAAGRGNRWSEVQLAMVGAGDNKMERGIPDNYDGGGGGQAETDPAAAMPPGQTTRLLRTWHRASSLGCERAFLVMGDMAKRAGLLEDQLRRLSQYVTVVSSLGDDVEMGAQGVGLTEFELRALIGEFIDLVRG
ncbi:uncharacterized protein CTRU02_215748 [Colletotrichum truncatum]|uniref:Uncharacterized protein n=1 Tax=Colletotrichum truncatum TaxID=5467 RepID=A0ACC3YBU6_COLTU|nr:uncharacterized protein CTRU02_15210 [Colletotrichum truncatum]KAF6781320.1 hypothetical protein CTRU02_15210 [Colletotrichum truncatum]